MKFGKLFRATVDGRMPQWKAFVVQYKELKQAIKKLVAKQRTPDAASPDGLVASFTQLLDVEVSRVNNFYMDRIEEGVIILQLLRQESDGVVAAAASSSGLSLAAQRHACKQQLVTFHLNLLILQNYVALNFMAVSKILKKFDKQLRSHSEPSTRQRSWICPSIAVRRSASWLRTRRRSFMRWRRSHHRR